MSGKIATAAVKAPERSRRERREESPQRERGASLTPPTYGVDVVDRSAAADAPVQRTFAAAETRQGAAVSLAPPSSPTSLPAGLTAGITALSGMDLSDVRVHSNSSSPAQLDALAYARGNDIHVAPGAEEHLAHEAWHVVQQRQGRVAATTQLEGGIAVNDDRELEREADVMGARAQSCTEARSATAHETVAAAPSVAVQRVFKRAKKAFTWVDLETNKAYQQVEIQVDNRIKLKRGTDIFYIESSDGQWNRVASAAAAAPVEESQSESESSGSDDEETAVVVDGSTAVTQILAQLKSSMRKDSNYSVALLENDDIIITKVNGVTSGTKGMDKLATLITTKRIEVGRNIFLAQKYNTALGSNHAEMCIVAAAAVMGVKVTEMACTGPNCPYCAAVLKAEKVKSANEGEAGKQQQGWAHPTKPVFWGTQVSNASVKAQVADLEGFLEGKKATIGVTTSNVSEGRYTAWL
jgi:hypothetical protein